MPPISNEVIIAAIGAFTALTTAFFAYLTVRLGQVKKLVDGTATLLAEQTRKNTEKALEVTEQRVAEAGEGNIENIQNIAANTKAIAELKEVSSETMTENTKEIASNTREIADNTTK